jgi:hypothetical protein
MMTPFEQACVNTWVNRAARYNIPGFFRGLAASMAGKAAASLGLPIHGNLLNQVRVEQIMTSNKRDAAR